MTIEKQDTGRTFGYGRASTDKQEESPEVQKAIHQRYVEFNHLPAITATFLDPATSATRYPLAKRTAGRELLATLRRGDHVIITMVDRMFRNLKDAANTLDEFQRKGIHLHVCNLMGGAIDLSSPMGEAMVAMLAVFARLESRFISMRTKQALANKQRTGAKHSRFPGYGYSWEKRRGEDGKLGRFKVRNDDERSVMRDIVLWRLGERQSTWDDIAKHLKKLGKLTKDGKPWSPNRVRRVFLAELALQAKEQGTK